MDELSQPTKPIIPSPTEGYSDYSLPWPWPNISIWCLILWKIIGATLKSNSEVTQLVHEVLQVPDFNTPDLS
ncbi:hypothetical protein J3R82DRAFT_3010 [Butyriboletus roseoflavus]|nr:hypothetical protein J3R82DRAFT_3010 [Butyriboletus roseoflavus]